ncbi:PREDICTED: CCR4-NOT transcription complex subunit 2-like isoform X4 [Branchiostoma belcheri]|uniref:CCR4-NOT transcription complex subunit 2 n=1 Tax=Branchiostoma belcheri TaxID=7741 RepID=A0A6P4ZIW0_BRABE|nr:PREDICTED: CCR4-NOT transcription complex subunit 2-like isoform X4 [Branchiostoma belcheri]
MAGMGQFGFQGQKENSPVSRKNMNLIGSGRKKGFGEEQDNEQYGDPTMYFQQVFPPQRPDKDQVPQMSQFAGLYGNQGLGGMGALGMQVGPRGVANPQQQFNRSMSNSGVSNMPPVPAGMPPSSPSRGLLSMGPRGMVNQTQGMQGLNIPNRNNKMPSGLASPNSRSSPILNLQPQAPGNPTSLGALAGLGLSRNQPFSSQGLLGSMGSVGSGSGFSSAVKSDKQSANTSGNRKIGQMSGNTWEHPWTYDFPALSDRRGSESGSNTVGSNMPGRAYAGMVAKPPSEPQQEFTIHNEDFPALPGTQNQENNRDENANKTPTSTAVSSAGGMADFSWIKSDSPGFKQFKAVLANDEGGTGSDPAKFPVDKSQKRGIQTLPDGTVRNIPAGMVTDQFGMVGLLTFIRAAETDPNMVALALGSDLTTLGLNLNSPENLYNNFGGPWADHPCRAQDIDIPLHTFPDFHVPSEYLTNIHIRHKLAPIKLNRYGEDLLFFMFYTATQDVLQLAAAAELYNRDWRYHKEERVWITRAPGMEPHVKTNTYERGTYYFFDAQGWRKVAKEFHLDYDKLEDRPHLPATLHHNPAALA